MSVSIVPPITGGGGGGGKGFKSNLQKGKAPIQYQGHQVQASPAPTSNFEKKTGNMVMHLTRGSTLEGCDSWKKEKKGLGTIKEHGKNHSDHLRSGGGGFGKKLS